MRVRNSLVGLVAGLTIMGAGAGVAHAALVVVQPCADSELTGVGGTINVLGCSGWFSGNLNGGSPTDIANADLAIRMLPGQSSFSGSGAGNFMTGGPTVDFSPTLLTGDVIVSFHNGAAKGEPGDLGGQATGFFEFVAPPGGISELSLSVPGWSNAEIWEDNGPVPTTFGGPTPEPATWALMLVGIGAIGAGLRINRRRNVAALAIA